MKASPSSNWRGDTGRPTRCDVTTARLRSPATEYGKRATTPALSLVRWLAPQGEAAPQGLALEGVERSREHGRGRGDARKERRERQRAPVRTPRGAGSCRRGG